MIPASVKKENKDSKYTSKSRDVVVRTRPPQPSDACNITLTKKTTIVDTSKKFTPPELQHTKKLDAFLKFALTDSSTDSSTVHHFVQYVEAQYLAMEDVRKKGGITDFVYPELLRLADIVSIELKNAANELLQITL